MKYRNTIKYLGLSSLLLLAACSGSAPLEPTPGPGPEPEQQTAITFGGGLQPMTEVTRAGADPLTRADVGLETVAKTFRVWAYKNTAVDDKGNSTPTDDNYTDYQVVIPGYTVNWLEGTAGTTTTNSHDWEYVAQATGQTIKYWDWDAKAYRYFGYALGQATDATPAVYEDPDNPESAIITPAIPATDPYPVTVTGGSAYDIAATTTKVSFTADVKVETENQRTALPYFSELWFSNGNPVDYPSRQFGQAVQLRFVQPLARARFLFISSISSSPLDRSLLSNISFHPTDNSKIPTSGKVSITYPLTGTATEAQWTTARSGGIKEFEIDYYEAPDPADVPAGTAPTDWPNTPRHWYYVLPVTTQGSYTVEASYDHKQVQTATVPAQFMSWDPGREYTYVFKLTQEGKITFEKVQVAISDWDDGGTAGKKVYNW